MTQQFIRLGTSAFTATGWEGTFYPAGMKPADYLSCYATKFDTVEVDSTFYHIPAKTTVQGWRRVSTSLRPVVMEFSEHSHLR
jgi:uncharacterized protein YecE (DUF72 family)